MIELEYCHFNFNQLEIEKKKNFKQIEGLNLSFTGSIIVTDEIFLLPKSGARKDVSF